MKSLDEVIKAMDMCINDNDAQNCLGCPYADIDGEAACYGHDREDALYYLKEYRAEKANLEIIKSNYQDAIVNCEKVENKFKTALKKWISER